MKWMHYQKHAGANRTLSAEEYFPITENNKYLLKEEVAEEECLEWAETINRDGSGERGFRYSWEVVDLPPADWLTKKIISVGKQREYLNEQIQLYVDTLIKHQNEQERTNKVQS